MTCEICHEREAVIFEVNTTERVKSRLCESCDRQRRTVSSPADGPNVSLLPRAKEKVGENIINLPQRSN